MGLLLWGTHMVTSGVLRGYGSDMRRWLGLSLHGRMKAFLAGLAVTALLQSSTATALMATSFASSRFIDVASGLSVMLGANVGTTLIVQVLSFNLAIVAPILILGGVVVFRRADGKTQVEELGRIVIGLGLMLLALSSLVRTTAPLERAPLLGAVLRSLAHQPVLAIFIAAGLTWACHSSVAIMLFIVSLVTSGAIAPVPALALVLGANLGGTLPAYFESGSGDRAAFAAWQLADPRRGLHSGSALPSIDCALAVFNRTSASAHGCELPYFVQFGAGRRLHSAC